MPDDEFQARQRSLEPTADTAWTTPATSPEDQQRKVADFLSTHALARRSWGDTRKNFQQVFPGIDPGDFKQLFGQLPALLKLDKARLAIAGEKETPGGWFWCRSIPLVSSGFSIGQKISYSVALNRLQAGEADEGDYLTIARYEQREAEAQGPFGVKERANPEAEAAMRRLKARLAR